MDMTHKGTVTLETARLTLRRFAAGDADAMFRNWSNDPEVTRYLTWPPHGVIENTRAVVDFWVKGYDSPDKYD
jgi:ribosomal-protein-alanine N-acetyltransferase